jgi:ElaB/YqjD/DUF883 family membrane-anchored ribosome-binding protein
MDHQADLRTQRPNDLRHHIDDTRDGLTEKLEALEQKVRETVADARSAVTDTVAGVKQSAHGSMQALKGAVRDGVESVKYELNPGRQVRRHPWTMLAGSMAAGYMMGRLLPQAPRVRRAATANRAETVPRLLAEGWIGAAEPRMPEAGVLSKLTEALAPEIQQLKGLALLALLDLTRKTIKQSIGPALGPELAGVIDRVTSKLGDAFEAPRLPSTRHP